jgi:formylglycine-generating enzyme required for sulfatase activity
VWNYVYLWATDDDTRDGIGNDDGDGHRNDGGAYYSFTHTGDMGFSPSWRPPTTSLHPVTNISWRDAIVWCNAATEWYNAVHSTRIECVYTEGGTVIRDSGNAAACDNNTANTAAKGFRLPLNNEWELAARFIADLNNDGDIMDPGEYYPGNFASGARADVSDQAATQEVAWHSMGMIYIDRTQVVKTKKPNALGIFDMSGNAYELMSDFRLHVITGPTWRGGSIGEEGNGPVRIGAADYVVRTYTVYPEAGFRFVRTK